MFFDNVYEALIEQGLLAVEQNNLFKAKKLFEESIAIQPTAEAKTYLGWIFSQEEKYDHAISLCKEAIKIDPTFGNPYNDIGTYLVAKGALEQSIGWFEKAKLAARYTKRDTPYLNLGRLYIRLSNAEQAKKEYESLLTFDPDNVEAQFILGRFVEKKNGIFSRN